MEPIQIILIAVIVIIVVAMGTLYILNEDAERKKRMMSVIQGGKATVGHRESEKDQQNKRRAEIAKKLKDSKDEDEGVKKKKKKTLSLSIQQAGLNISVKQYWIICVIFTLIATGTAFLMGQPPFVLLMVTITALLGVPRFVLNKMASKRQQKFLEEFPDALEATVRLLRAGMPVSEAIRMCSREFSGPVGDEMSRIYDRQKIGIPLHEAAIEATKRMPLSEMQMFATGLAIQAQTGSSLSEVLTNLSGVIRARFRLKRKVKALSSEAIASASIIGSLPNLLALGMYFANREYIMLLFNTSIGNIILAGAVGWMLIGIFVMRTMIDFKI